MKEFNITTIARRYRRLSTTIVAGVSLLFLLLSNVFNYPHVVHAIVVSALFSLFFSFAYLEIWKYFANKSSHKKTMFYFVGMGMRFLLSVFIVIIACLLTKEKTDIISFVVIFSLYYFVMMIFETTYFVFIEQKRIK